MCAAALLMYLPKYIATDPCLQASDISLVLASPWYNTDMNFAHMVGEHHYQSTTDKLSHVVMSWTGFVVAVVIGGAVCYVVYRQIHNKHVKQETRK